MHGQAWAQLRAARSGLGGVPSAHCADPYHRLWHQPGNLCTQCVCKLHDLDKTILPVYNSCVALHLSMLRCYMRIGFAVLVVSSAQ